MQRGDIVNNIVTTSYIDRWVTDCDHIVKYINVKSLCCTPATNMVCPLYFNKKIVNVIMIIIA